MSGSPSSYEDRVSEQIGRAARSHSDGIERVILGEFRSTENGHGGDGLPGDGDATGYVAITRENGQSARDGHRGYEIDSSHAAELILEHIDDIAFLLDAHRRIRFANERASEVCGLPPEQLEEAPIDILLEEGLVGEAAFERVDEGVRTALSDATEGSHRFELEVLPHRERPLVVDVRLSPLVDADEPYGVVGVVRNVTRRHEAEQAVRESEGKFRALAEKALVGTYIYQDGSFVYVNPRFAEISGYDRSELVDTADPIDLAHPHDRDRIRRLVQDRLNGESDTVRYECCIQRRDGDTRDVQVLGTRIQYRDRPALIGTIVDITPHVEYENALVEARDEARQMSRLKTSFLANMSHEIRTPLSSILGYAEVLEEEASPELQEFVELIQNSGERLLETLNSVLDLAQIESGSINLRPKEFDLAELVRNTARAFEREAEEKGLQLETDSDPEKIPGRMDRALLARIVTNLVHNAVKFTDEGTVSVEVTDQGERIFVTVTDTGIGISESELPSLFQAFRQESTGAHREYEGAGLGLAITSQLVDLVGGSIEVTSEKGAGSTFRVELPRHLEEDAITGD